MNTFQNGSRFSLFPVSNFAREMNRMMDQTSYSHQSRSTNAPATIWEDDKSYFFEFDLPGVHVDDVDVKIADHELHVSAKRPVKADIEFLHQERAFGSVERSFQLASNIDDSSIEAELANGVLKLTIAKAPEAQVKKIEIKSRS